MSTKPETTFYTSVHKHLPKLLYKVKMSNPYVGGIPDCWYSGEGLASHDLWVEYKFIIVPKRPDTVIDFGFTQLQLDWMNDRHNEGRFVWGIVGCKNGGIILKNGQWNRKNMTQKQYLQALNTRQQLAHAIREHVGWTGDGK